MAADCDALYDTYARRSAGLHDNAFERLPIADFNEGDVHFSPAGARHISEKVGQQVFTLMRENP